MKTFFNVLASLSAALAVCGFWIVWTILHSPGDDNPFALIGAFLCFVGVFFAALFAWVAKRR